MERQNSGRPIPQIVIRCVDYLVKSGTLPLVLLPLPMSSVTFEVGATEPYA